MKITTEQKQKWLYHINKHKTKIDEVVSKQFDILKADDAFATEAFKQVGEDQLDIVCFKALLNFYTDIMQQLWKNFERLIELHKEKVEQEKILDDTELVPVEDDKKE